MIFYLERSMCVDEVGQHGDGEEWECPDNCNTCYCKAGQIESTKHFYCNPWFLAFIKSAIVNLFGGNENEIAQITPTNSSLSSNKTVD